MRGIGCSRRRRLAKSACTSPTPARTPPGAHFIDQPIQTWRELIQRNVVTLTEACHGFARRMLPRGRGGLILMGSGAGLGGQPRVAVYSSTKGFDLNLGESLWIGAQAAWHRCTERGGSCHEHRDAAEGHARARHATPPASSIRRRWCVRPWRSCRRGPPAYSPPGFDAVGPEVLAENRRKRVLAVSEATKMFFGEA